MVNSGTCDICGNGENSEIEVSDIIGEDLKTTNWRRSESIVSSGAIRPVVREAGQVVEAPPALQK